MTKYFSYAGYYYYYYYYYDLNPIPNRSVFPGTQNFKKSIFFSPCQGMCFRESVEWFIEGAEQWTINSFECGSCRVVPARRGAGCELRLRAAAPEEALYV